MFQQDGAHALYGEYKKQWLNTTILLYLCGAWGLVIGYLVHCKCHVPQKAKDLGYMLCNISCVTSNQIMGT